MDVVGNGKRGFVDGDARETEMNRPFGIYALKDGTLVFTDAHNNAVRFAVRDSSCSMHSKTRRRYQVKTVANSGLLAPKGIAASADERHLFVCDTGHHRIKLAALPSRSVLAGVSELAHGVEMFTFAGNGKKGWRDGSASDCSFNSPSGVCELVDGTIVVADTGNHCIRHIRRAATSGKLIVRTIAGGYMSMETRRSERGTRLSGHRDGTQALFRSPSAVLAGPHGEILVVDTMNNCIRGLLPPLDKRSPWQVRTICGQTRPGYTNGNCDVALFDQPVDLCWGANGDTNSFFVADRGNTSIRQVGRSYEAFGECLSFSWVRTIEVGSIPQTPRNQELFLPLGITCLRQKYGEDASSPQLVICDGDENVIKLLPLVDITTQTKSTKNASAKQKLLETRPVSAPSCYSERDINTDMESPNSTATEPAPIEKLSPSPVELSENQSESNPAECCCECSPALAHALELNAALKAENMRLRELLESTFEEIQLADKRFADNFTLTNRLNDNTS